MPGSILGIFWNLGLALIPVLLAWALVAWSAARKERGLRRFHGAMIPVGLAWLAFLPNACYLVTEWRHFLYDPGSRFLLLTTTPRDLSVLRVVKHAAFYLGYSGFGVFCFALSVRPLDRWFSGRASRIAIRVALFLFASLGVYMGLIVRLNSWDLLTRPGFVFSVAARPLNRPELLATVILFAAILWLAYEFALIWLEGAEARLRKLVPIRIRNR